MPTKTKTKPKNDNLVKARAAKKIVKIEDLVIDDPEEEEIEEETISNGKPKKISSKIIEKATEESKNTRAYQSKFDNKYNIVAYKYNQFPCEDCGFDIEIIGISFFADPITGRKFVNLRKTCQTKCMLNDQIYELADIKLEDLEKDKIDSFNIYS